MHYPIDTFVTLSGTHSRSAESESDQTVAGISLVALHEVSITSEN